MPHPPAEIELSDADVERLVRSQHPSLVGPLRRVAHGWDNDVFRLGDDLAVRLPRRASAAALIVHEQQWLPMLADRLPVRVPAPIAVGVPDETFPWNWSVVPWFDGASAIDLAPAERDEFAGELALTLRALHVPAPADAPRNPVRGVPMRERNDVVAPRLVGWPVLEQRWREALAAPQWQGPPVWVHGDVHLGNIVISEGRVVALIDFGDMCAGDPACDLAIAWLGFTPAGRAVFRETLGERYVEADWCRARGWAASFATLMADLEDPAYRAMAAHAVAQLALD